MNMNTFHAKLRKNNTFRICIFSVVVFISTYAYRMMGCIYFQIIIQQLWKGKDYSWKSIFDFSSSLWCIRVPRMGDTKSLGVWDNSMNKKNIFIYIKPIFFWQIYLAFFSLLFLLLFPPKFGFSLHAMVQHMILCHGHRNLLTESA